MCVCLSVCLHVYTYIRVLLVSHYKVKMSKPLVYICVCV